jgi:catechol 2,3-dioxygenase-like lactoylglutathione lyase family enzyme
MLRHGVGLAIVTALAAPSSDRAPAVVGLDHVPIAVADLDQAADRYRALGFTLKPGRPHANGITNQHAKFADGTELELITAPAARDALTTTYRRHLAQGDGPAFLALFAPDLERAAERLRGERIAASRRGPIVDLEGPGFEYLFLGGRNASPTDRPEHFAHANGATSLIAVWLAGELSSERTLFEALGARVTTEEVRVPERVTAPVARFGEGDVVLLPADRQLVPGRRIVGVTLRVRTLAALETVLGRAGERAPQRVPSPGGASVFVPPDRARGLWIEFRESP